MNAVDVDFFPYQKLASLFQQNWMYNQSLIQLQTIVEIDNRNVADTFIGLHQHRMSPKSTALFFHKKRKYHLISLTCKYWLGGSKICLKLKKTTL